MDAHRRAWAALLFVVHATSAIRFVAQPKGFVDDESAIECGEVTEASHGVVIIGGAAKSGTSALHAALRSTFGGIFYPQQQQVPGPVHHFNDAASYAEGVEAYFSKLGCGSEVLIDESPMYLAHPTALYRAVSQVPWARWVIVLRDPVDRAYSHYMMLSKYAAQKGLTETSFAEAIEDDRRCVASALGALSQHGHASFVDEKGPGTTPARLATRYAYEHCARTRPGGALAGIDDGGGAAELEIFGAAHGILAQSLYAAQLDIAAGHATRHGLEAPRLVAVSMRALLDDKWRTLVDVLMALDLRDFGLDATVVRSVYGAKEASYKSLRSNVPPPLLDALDDLFHRPNCALASTLADASVAPKAVGFENEPWLPPESSCYGTAIYPHPQVERDEL